MVQEGVLSLDTLARGPLAAAKIVPNSRAGALSDRPQNGRLRAPTRHATRDLHSRQKKERLAKGLGPPELKLVWLFATSDQGVKSWDPRKFDTEKEAATARAEVLKGQGIGTGKVYVSRTKTFGESPLNLAVREGRAYDPRKINLGEADDATVSSVPSSRSHRRAATTIRRV